MKPKVLIIDDEIQSLEICTRKLIKTYDIYTARFTDDALILLSENRINCIITDLIMPDVDGMEFVYRLQELYPDIPLLVMSGKATVNMAVDAMKAGAIDFIEKPIVDLEILPVYVKKALNSSKLISENINLKKQLAIHLTRDNFIGNSLPIQKMLSIIEKVSKLNTTILIEGETGSGKELVARLLHQNSLRSDKPFVAVNCGAVPDSLLESILFGHSRGAFTGAVKEAKGYFEEANKGTLFLDEIGETSIAFQIKLLRVLQERRIRRVGEDRDHEVDVRIITATNKDLEKEVSENHFRKDLFYRLNVIKLQVPSLSERRDDIPLLLIHFLNNFMEENNLKDYNISQKAVNILKNASWEGNVRELQNVIEHAAAMCQGGMIDIADLPDYIVNGKISNSLSTIPLDYNDAKLHFDNIFFKRLLKETSGNISKAARISGLTRQHIYIKLKKLGWQNSGTDDSQD